ncbi:MAG: hypothetical protein JXB38_07950 [Anaerolineales bacterium]|nr:hypothetical protein [Anaerolineales bacterium]
MRFFRNRAFLLPVVLVLVLAACTPAATATPPTETTPAEELPPAAALEAQRWLADQLGVTVEEVKLQHVEQTEWSDSCLGLGGAAEICAQVITPGWQVVFSVNGQEYEVRTNEDATSIRMQPIGS